MNRPATLASAERYAHGMRGRYVSGCRCDACREANRLTYHARHRRGLELAAELTVTPFFVERTYPNGVRRRRACPGVFGEACARGRLLRPDSAAVCRDCRLRLSFNGLISAEPARKHLLALARRGIGYKAAADAASIARTVIGRIRRGHLKRIRVVTAQRILSIDTGARADGSRVPGRPTWKRIDALIARGFTRTWIAQQLGQRGPGLQIRRDRVLASTELAVRRLFEEYRNADPPARPSRIVTCSCARPLPLREYCARCEKLLPLAMEAAA